MIRSSSSPLFRGSEPHRSVGSYEESSIMTKRILRSKVLWKVAQSCIAVLCSALLVPGEAIFAAQSKDESAAASQQEAATIPADQLDSLVAPIALYPDPMLAQVLAASTYPLEIVQLQQWLEKNKTLKDKALADAVQKQPWDPSVQGLAAMPDLVKRLANDIQWTTDLGNAFLAQQSDVMDAVQRMRKKAQDTGNLKSTEQQKVETKVVESKAGHCRSASQSRSGLRAYLQPDCRVWRAGLPLSSHLLSAARILRGWRSDFLRCGSGHGSRLGRRLGLRLRLGRQQRHHHQQQ